MGQGGAEREGPNEPENQKGQPSERRRPRQSTRNRRDKSRSNLRDSTGLDRIHWAALNNRCDLIERLCGENPALVSKRCQNNLFADGTPLHLAAMNGSLEAARMLMAKGLTQAKLDNQTTSAANGEPDIGALAELLEARDLEGQTPLMRTAAPRSKKWNTIRELLMKNFWSLSGRAAEMALLLIAAGADWTKTEPVNGMNLMHLAILNDYDDIVSLLLVLDRRLIGVATLKARPEVGLRGGGGAEETQLALKGSGSAKSKPELDGPDLSEGSSVGSTSRRPLIDSARENAEDLLARGLKPLELAILYGRVKMINLLWRPQRSFKPTESSVEPTDGDAETRDQAELKQLLVRACFSDSDEMAKFVKPLILKALLAIDLAVVALVWAPAYCLKPVIESDAQGHERMVSVRPSLRGGLFFASYCLAMALTLRVMLKNPGFLRRHSVHYLSELASLLQLAPRAREMIARRLGKSPDATKKELPSEPRIHLDERASILVDGKGRAREAAAAAANKVQEDHEDEDRNNKITTLALDPEPSVSNNISEGLLANKLLEIQRGVRYLCHRCQCIRRPRSRHCNLCDHCVQDFDHHCIYLGCCIGRYNRLDFLLALIVLSVTGCFGAILQAVGVRHAHELGHQSGWSHFWHFVSFVWIFKYALIGGVTAFCQLRRACLGVTMYEEARSKKLRTKFGRRGPSEEISRTYASLSALDEGEGSFWRYLPYEGDQLDRRWRQRFRNLREFANQISPDEYLLTLIGTDTPLARSLLTRSSDLRIKQQKKQHAQRLA